jgi:hypothetical protein
LILDEIQPRAVGRREHEDEALRRGFQVGRLVAPAKRDVEPMQVGELADARGTLVVAGARHGPAGISTVMRAPPG